MSELSIGKEINNNYVWDQSLNFLLLNFFVKFCVTMTTEGQHLHLGLSEAPALVHMRVAINNETDNKSWSYCLTPHAGQG